MATIQDNEWSTLTFSLEYTCYKNMEIYRPSVAHVLLI